MTIITTSRDHKCAFTSKELKRCEKFVGKSHYAYEEGIDDQYTQFYFSSDIGSKLIYFILGLKYRIWHLLDEGIEFKSNEDIVAQLNERGRAFEGDDDWEEIEMPK